MVCEFPIALIQKFVHDFLDGSDRKGPWAATITWCLLFLIALNVLAFLLETLAPVVNRHGLWFNYILYVSISLFALAHL